MRTKNFWVRLGTSFVEPMKWKLINYHCASRERNSHRLNSPVNYCQNVNSGWLKHSIIRKCSSNKLWFERVYYDFRTFIAVFFRNLIQKFILEVPNVESLPFFSWFKLWSLADWDLEWTRITWYIMWLDGWILESIMRDRKEFINDSLRNKNKFITQRLQSFE